MNPTPNSMEYEYPDPNTEQIAIIKLFVDTSPSAIALFDREARYMALSEMWANDFGFEPRDVIGLTHLELTSYRSELVSEANRRALAGETLRIRDEFRPLPDRPSRWMSGEIRPWYFADGSIGGAVASLTDITEEVLTCNRLDDRDQQLRLFIEHAPVALAVFDREMRCLAFSKRFLADFFPHFTDLTGRYLYEIFPDCPEKWRDNNRRGMAGEVVRQQAESWVNQKGELRWIRYEVRPWLTRGGLIGGIIMFSEDITDLKRAEQAVEARAAELSSVLDTAADAIVSINHLGEILRVNPATERMFGYTADEMVGNNISMLMTQGDASAHASHLRRYSETGEARIIGFGREVTARRKDGTTFTVDLAVSPVQGNGFTGIMRDQTERVQTRKRLLELAAQQQADIGRELHDGLQQELSGLMLFTSTLKAGLARMSPERAGTEVELRQLREALVHLTDGLAKAQHTVRDLARGIMPVQVGVDGLRTALRELAIRTDDYEEVTCRFDSPEPVPLQSESTANHLYRIAQEALNNALKHARAKRIVLTLTQEGDRLIVKVADDGVGFDVAKSGGGDPRSLGLRSMAYRAEAIGGILQIESELGKGTTVTCSIPGECTT